jgi:peptidoglycan/xylan/chitin deacetylase (PgdA/CDA1 family)
MNDHLPALPLLLADVPASLRQALGQEGIPVADHRSGRPGRFVLFDSPSACGSLAAGQVGIDINRLRGRPADALAALADERAACKEWQIGGLRVRETVARVERTVVRRRLLAALRERVEEAGGVWLRVSPYPAGYRSAFNFRLDHDDYVPGDFDATLSAIEGHEQAISHYVCAGTHVHHPEALVRLRGMHVGSHGWRHHTYRDPSENLHNIRRGIDGLRAVRLDPVGFVAPHGRFNAGLLAALSELGVTHSSEFGLAYDDLPFFPRESDVLQIPVHPICLGVCLDAARRGADRPMTDEQAAEMALEHWRTAVAQKRIAGEPIFLYGHPDGRIGRFPALLRRLLAEVDRLPDVWRTSLANFERWWRDRAAIEITAWRRRDAIEIAADGLPARYRANLEYVRGDRYAEIGLDRPRQSPCADALDWRPCQEPLPSVTPTVVHQGWRAGVREYLDWERVTPIGEIDTRTWRGWAKRTLRRVRT